MFSVVEIVCEIRLQLQNLRCGNLVITLLILTYHNFFNASPRVLLYIGLIKIIQELIGVSTLVPRLL